MNLLLASIANSYVQSDDSEPTPGSYEQTVLADIPAAYWRMGEASGTTMTDYSGNGMNGTYVGSPALGSTGLVYGDDDTAVKFSSSLMYAIANADIVATTALTVEAIVRPTSLATGGGYILSKCNITTGFGASWAWVLSMAANGGLNAYVFTGNSSTNFNIQIAKQVFAVGVATHVAMRYDGSTLKLFINGGEVGSVTASGTLNAASGIRPIVGIANNGSNVGYTGASSAFPGTIDEAAIYTTALPASRIKAHALAATPAPPNTSDPYASSVMSDSPLAYWRLSDASGAYELADASGNQRGLADASPTAGTVTYGATGLLSGTTDQAVSFATGGRLLSPLADWMKISTITVEAIIKPTQTASVAVVAAREDWSFAYGSPYSWALYQNGSGLMAEAFVGNTGTHATATSASGLITSGQTYHVAMTYDGNTLTIYLNGASVATASVAGSLSPGVTPLTIGQPYYNQNTFVGTIDEVAIYGSALSVFRIQAHASAAGLLGAYNAEVLADSPGLFWKFDENASGATAIDSSGNGRNGTVVGTPVMTAPAVMPTGVASYTLDTTAKYVTLAADNWMNVSTWTVEAWVRLTNVTSLHAIMSRDGNSGSRGWTVYIRDGLIQAHNGTVGFNGNTTLTTGVTYHVVVTYDGTTVTLYLNGAVDGSTTQTMPANASRAINVGMSLAGTASANFPLTGNIDYVAYYPTTLSAARIAAHYAAAADAYALEILKDGPQAYWRLGDASGATAGDISGNGHSGTYNETYALGAPLLSGATDGSLDLTTSPGGYAAFASNTWMTATTVHTVEAWATRNGTSWDNNTGGVIVARDSTSDSFSNRSWYLYWNDDGTISWRAFSGSAEKWNIASPAVSNGLHHFVGVRSGNSALLFVDGLLVAAATFSAGNTNNQQAITIGRAATQLANGLRYFNGRIDEVAYWTSALSAQRIAAHYTKGTGNNSYALEVIKDSPIYFLRMNDLAASSVAMDYSGGIRNGSYVGSPTKEVAGLLNDGTAVTLNGSSQYVSIPASSAANVTNFSIEIWYKGTGSGYLVNRDDTGSTKVWDVVVGVSGTISFINWDGLAGSPQSLAGSVNVADNQPHHIVCVKSGLTVSIYIDGVLDASTTLGTTPPTSASPVINIGRRANGASSYLAGTVDDFAFYGTALGTDRITAHYAQR